MIFFWGTNADNRSKRVSTLLGRINAFKLCEEIVGNSETCEINHTLVESMFSWGLLGFLYAFTFYYNVCLA